MVWSGLASTIMRLPTYPSSVVCNKDASCSPLVVGGEGAVCYQGSMAVNYQHAMCNVTSGQRIAETDELSL